MSRKRDKCIFIFGIVAAFFSLSLLFSAPMFLTKQDFVQGHDDNNVDGEINK